MLIWVHSNTLIVKEKCSPLSETYATMAARMATKPRAPLAIWMCVAAPDEAVADALAVRDALDNVALARVEVLLLRETVALELAGALPVTTTDAVRVTVVVVEVVVSLLAAKTASGIAMRAKLEKRILMFVV
jgi:hypothetical protein